MAWAVVRGRHGFQMDFNALSNVNGRKGKLLHADDSRLAMVQEYHTPSVVTSGLKEEIPSDSQSVHYVATYSTTRHERLAGSHN